MSLIVVRLTMRAPYLTSLNLSSIEPPLSSTLFFRVYRYQDTPSANRFAAPPLVL